MISKTIGFIFSRGTRHFQTHPPCKTRVRLPLPSSSVRKQPQGSQENFAAPSPSISSSSVMISPCFSFKNVAKSSKATETLWIDFARLAVYGIRGCRCGPCGRGLFSLLDLKPCPDHDGRSNVAKSVSLRLRTRKATKDMTTPHAPRARSRPMAQAATPQHKSPKTMLESHPLAHLLVISKYFKQVTLKNLVTLNVLEMSSVWPGLVEPFHWTHWAKIMKHLVCIWYASGPSGAALLTTSPGKTCKTINDNSTSDTLSAPVTTVTPVDWRPLYTSVQ